MLEEQLPDPQLMCYLDTVPILSPHGARRLSAGQEAVSGLQHRALPSVEAGRTAGPETFAAGGTVGHQCVQCGALFKNEGSLKHHVQVHLGHTVCPLCGTTYSRRQYLKVHLATKHDMTPAEAKQLLDRLHESGPQQPAFA